MRMIRRMAAVAAVLALTTTAAQSASYTFNLQNTANGGDAASSSTANSLTIDKGGLQGTFSGHYVENPVFTGSTITGGTGFDANSVRRWNNGLGVCNVGPCDSPPAGDPLHTVDGTSLSGARNDFVEMSFESGGSAANVQLTSLTFGWIGQFNYGQWTLGYGGTNGAFEILMDTVADNDIGLGDTVGLSGLATINLPGCCGRGLYDVSGAGLFDNFFGVKAGVDGSWKLLAVTVDYDPAVVPLPGAAWLLIGGLGGLAALRRRKQA